MRHGTSSRKRAEPTLSRIPPLTALRAFTATARHLNFVRAAEELHVTPAAIGQHVRQLETHFGCPLFLRNRGQLELTQEGRDLFPGLQQAFELVLSTVSRLDDANEAAELRISAPSSFISKWLAPRLAEIQAELPEIRIVMQHDEDKASAGKDRPSCSITLAPSGIFAPDADYLFQEEIIPVCSPSYRMRFGLAWDDFGLDRITLLGHARQSDAGFSSDWGRWLKTNGAQEGIRSRNVTFTEASMVIDAALAGQGVGLASLALLERDLAAGRLVVPYGLPMPPNHAYVFAHSDFAIGSAPVALFRRWLLREAAKVRLQLSSHVLLEDQPLSIAAE